MKLKSEDCIFVMFKNQFNRRSDLIMKKKFLKETQEARKKRIATEKANGLAHSRVVRNKKKDDDKFRCRKKKEE